MSLEIRGGFDLAGLRTRVRAALPAATKAAMEHVGEVSAQQVPIEEGTLLRSQKIGNVEGNPTTAYVSYGTPYARFQHEVMELHHEHGNAKFLELPVATEADTALKIVARAVKGAM